jgi:hypothetical protein
VRELDELPLPYTFDVKAYEAIKLAPLKRRIDEFGRILYGGEASFAVTEAEMSMASPDLPRFPGG